MALSDIVEEDMSWTNDANCIGRYKMFDNYEKGGIYAHEADQMCLNCPVIKECFDFGSRGAHGQWGGVFWNGSGQPDLKANEHKTPEYIAKVEEMVE